jgi:hypothetical protein
MKNAKKKKKPKNNLTMDNYCWQWLTRDKPNLSSERAPHRDKNLMYATENVKVRELVKAL